MSIKSRFEDLKKKFYLDFLGLQEVCVNAVNKLRRVKPEPQCMTGTTTIITGGNAGIGRATAEELIRRGSNIVLACRNRITAEETATALRQCNPYFDILGTVEIADVDLGSLDSVKSLVSTLSSRKKVFDCIIANGGIMTPPTRSETENGLEKQFQVNYLGHFLLVHELLKNKKSEYELPGQNPPRCVFLSSMTHFGATLEQDLDPKSGDLQAKVSYDPFRCYANSKLCQLLAAKEFNQRMKDGSCEFPVGGCAVAVHPGIVDTALARQYFKDQIPKVLHPILDKFFFPVFLKTPKAAAQCVLYAATAPAEEVGGKYIQECAVTRSSKASNDVVLAHRLWKKSKELAGLEI